MSTYIRKKLSRKSGSGGSLYTHANLTVSGTKRLREDDGNEYGDNAAVDNDNEQVVLLSAGQHFTTTPISRYRHGRLPGLPSARPRTRFSPIGCECWAYPSAGGVVYGFFTAVQLKQMGLSNMEEADRSSPNEDGGAADEDRLALTLLRQGAHWWPSWAFYCRHRDNIHRVLYGFHFPPCVHTAYTAPEAASLGRGKGRRGEVWVLKGSEDVVFYDDHAERDPDKQPWPSIPEGWYARVNLATTPGERCKVFKQFGATYYENWKDCEDIPKTLEEGVQKGKEYETLLKRMQDPNYVRRWTENGSTDWPAKAV
ncbi:hypothetical protein PG993_004414 [Apiospora rasikravindrae]|uniref:Uncharacterized protein n=1 Tax=Apiospora rasikravindrae TaxID=990691 RepID=A0ABR1TEP1_9PEZI